MTLMRSTPSFSICIELGTVAGNLSTGSAALAPIRGDTAERKRTE